MLFSPMTIQSGADVHLHLSFLPDQYLQMWSKAYNSSQEYIGVSFLNPQPAGRPMTEYTQLNYLSGESVNLDTALPFGNYGTGSLSMSSARGLSVADFNDSTLTFNGWDMLTTFTSVDGGPVTVSGINFCCCR